MSLEDDLNFIKECDIVQINRPIKLDKIKKIIQTINSTKILFVIFDEIPDRVNSEFTDFLNFAEDELKLEVRVMVSTLSSYRFSTYPLFNFSSFCISNIQQNPFDSLNNPLTERTSLFDTNIFYKNKKINLENKKIKGILSSRRVSDSRNIIFNFAKQNKFEGILRYLKWDVDVSFELDYINQFPNWKSLVNEYDKSFVSFVLETENSPSLYKENLLYDITPFSEKTILPFMTFSIPIIFGNVSIVEKLTSLGFWVANDDFGFGSGDIEILKKNRIKRYLKCIEKYNNLSINDIKKYYIDNKENIQKNYDLAASIICNNEVKRLFNTTYQI